MNTLIEAYIEEIGQQLPNKTRADIQAEIRSLIEDTLADRSQAAGREVDDEMVVEVLKEFGSPEKMAASYLPERYLIGPRLYPIFMLVIRIVTIVVAVVAVIGLGVAMGKTGGAGPELVTAIGQSVIGFVNGFLQALGNIVLIFAILQWAMPNLKVNEQSWDPRSLKIKPSPERIEVGAQIADVVFTMAAILIFNFYPQWVMFATNTSGEWTFSPILAASFFAFLPLFNLAWLLSITRSIILLRQGVWTSFTRWFSVGASIFSMVILVMLLSSTPLVNLDMPMEALRGISSTSFSLLNGLLLTGYRALLILILALEAVNIGKQVYRLVNQSKLTISLDNTPGK
jgi:hypothetical protein